MTERIPWLHYFVEFLHLMNFEQSYRHQSRPPTQRRKELCAEDDECHFVQLQLAVHNTSTMPTFPWQINYWTNSRAFPFCSVSCSHELWSTLSTSVQTHSKAPKRTPCRRRRVSLPFDSELTARCSQLVLKKKTRTYYPQARPCNASDGPLVWAEYICTEWT